MTQIDSNIINTSSLSPRNKSGFRNEMVF